MNIYNIDPKYRPIWDNRSEDEQAALAAYYLPRRSKKTYLEPTRPRVIKLYCPFASQCEFPSGHRYCINVFVGCGFACDYCYARAYEPDSACPKKRFRQLIDKDVADLERFNVPPAPVHVSNSCDPCQPLERHTGHLRYALEQILAHRQRFTKVILLTKNPMLPVELDYIPLFRDLSGQPDGTSGFQIQVSLAFWDDQSRAAYEPLAPTVQQRIAGITALRAAGIPVVLRIDPLFPRSPLSTNAGAYLSDFGLVEAQTVAGLEELVRLAKRLGCEQVTYSALKIVRPRTGLRETMQKMLDVFRAICAPGKPVWRNCSWRLPKDVLLREIVNGFLDICGREHVPAKFCMHDLIENR